MDSKFKKVLAAASEGSGVTVEALSVTENGTYTAPEGKAYSPVEVNVPSGSTTTYYVVRCVNADYDPDAVELWKNLSDIVPPQIVEGTVGVKQIVKAPDLSSGGWRVVSQSSIRKTLDADVRNNEYVFTYSRT